MDIREIPPFYVLVLQVEMSLGGFLELVSLLGLHLSLHIRIGLPFGGQLTAVLFVEPINLFEVVLS